METLTLSPKFQVVIPKEIRESLGLSPGQKIKAIAFANRIEKTVDSDGNGTVDSTLRFAHDGWKTGTQRSFVGRFASSTSVRGSVAKNLP